jgi:transcription termination factor NusA
MPEFIMSSFSNQNQSTAFSALHRDASATVGSISLLNQAELAELAAHGITALDDLADLASDELLDLLGPKTMSRARADQIIMAARAHWFAETN